MRGEYHNNQGQNRIANPDHKPHEGAEQVLTHPAKSAIHDTAWHIIPVLFRRMLDGMGHMVRQYQKALDQRGNQHHDHGKRNVGNQIAKATANRGQAKKGNHRGQR